jgi:predicted nucleotide-binding protein
MKIADISGYWTGEINGTNRGGLVFEITQNGPSISGIAKVHEPALGRYECVITGTIADRISLRLTPGQRTHNLVLGVVQVVCTLEGEETLSGRWKSELGTEGTFNAKRFDSKGVTPVLPKSNSVFLVHGHDDGAKHAVARFLEQLGITPVILQEQLNCGMTVIEKFESFASRAGFAIVLMTPDDFGYPVGKEDEKTLRPRQNVVLELGYFAAKLGRSKTLVLSKGNLEMPSDILGLVYEPLDKSGGWKIRLAKELKAAGFSVDLNKAVE